MIMCRQITAWEGTLTQGTTIVVDIGKTMSKVSLWTSAGEMLDRQSAPMQLSRSMASGVSMHWPSENG